ncbi:MAG: tetratricopeptide repeat protein [Terriglobales bacterium]
MRISASISAALGLGIALAAQAPMPVHHEIVTHGVAAQRAFDRGLALDYGFNYAEAEREFRRAAALDPSAPMPWWGLALALGPNLNAPWPSRADELKASDALGTARVLAAKLPPSAEAREEHAYIAALTLRFDCQPRPDYPRIAQSYANAMGRLVASYPDDSDAATLYAAALMVERHNARYGSLAPPLPPWPTILGVLRGVLRRWPGHIGANHFYIHASEGAGDPAQALASARLLEKLQAHGFFGDGHLLHMSAHVYLRTGHYRAAERATLAAAAADRAYLARNPTDVAYAVGYAQHNLSFLVTAASMDGDYATALAAAKQLASSARSTAKAYRSTAANDLAPLRVELSFARWADILADPPPAGASAGEAVFARYARANALAGQGRAQPAVGAMRVFLYALRQSPRVLISVPSMPRFTAENLLRSTLEARVAAAQGHYAFAVTQWKQAIAAQDGLGYREPPAWYPLRESLGSVLLRAGEPAQAAAVFRDCLKHWPNDPRAEFGLAKSLGAEGQHAAAMVAMRAFRAEWKGGPLRLADF